MSEISTMVLSVEELSRMVHKSPASIRSDASRNPTALPPICRLPGNKRLLFRLEDVQAWLAQHVDRSLVAPVRSVELYAPSTARKRGRPRKVA